MVAVDWVATRIVAAVLALVIVGVIVISVRGFRRARHRRSYAIIGAYDVVLLALWAGATLVDDGYGAAYLPGIILTAPWSFVVIFQKDRLEFSYERLAREFHRELRAVRRLVRRG